MKKTYFTPLITISVFLCLFTAPTAQPGIAPASASQELYKEYCAPCHGLSGQGNGELEYLIYPKPRDFTRGLFKIRSTPAGSPPTEEDLYRTIQNGMTGSAMPAFYFLADQEIRSLVEYVKVLANIKTQITTPIQIPEPLPFSEKLVQVGKNVYSEVGCNKCHGDLGKGDGPSAYQLVDSWGYPIVPRDFTAGIYLGDSGIKDLYLRFVGGVDGTPMPAYGDLARDMGKSPAEQQELMWGLIYYVKSLESKAVPEAAVEPQDGIINAARVGNRVKPAELFNFGSRNWTKAETYSIPVSRLWQRERVNYNKVKVRALYNRNYVALMLEWDDNSQDQSTYRIQDFQDAAAVQFSLDGKIGFHGMGSVSHPTDIWYWKAEWQARRDQNAASDIALAYGNRASDSDIDTYPELIDERSYLPGRDAGNYASLETVESPVENVNAVGPQTVTVQDQSDQNVTGKGAWNGTGWRIVFLRKLTSESSSDVKFIAGGSVPVTFAVWNGREGDRNGQKMVSTWYTLKLKK